MDDSSTSISDTPANSDDNRSNILISLEEMIKSHLSSIDKLQDELDQHQGMLNDIFDQDPTYKIHSQKAKEASQVKSTTKQQILKQPQAAELAGKVKTIQSDIKELQTALSDYLQQFQQMSGINEIEGEDGEVRQIVYVARLVKKSSLPQ